MNFKAGFPLAEVFGYVAFILVVVLVGAASINGYHTYSTNQEALSGASSIGAALSQYHFEVGSYPDNLSDLTSKNGQYGPWLISLPTDPWANGANYQYLHNDSQFAVFSVGRDGGVNSTIQRIGTNDLGYIGK